MIKLNQILKPLAVKSKWAFLFFKERINRGTFQTAYRVLIRKVLMWNTYTTLYDLPLLRYVVINCDKTLKPLKKVPLWTPMWLLNEIYELLMEEYAELTENKEIAFQKKKQSNIEQVKSNIVHYTLCAQVLIAEQSLGKESEFIIQHLKEKRISAPTINELLKKLSVTIKNLNFQLKELSFEMESQKTEVGEVTRANYSQIIAIANKNGYYASYEMKTADFIQVMNLQRKEHEELEKLKNKK
jgi:hypothetical protein